MAERNNSELDDLKFIPQTTKHVLEMTDLLKDEKATKGDVLVKLADAKITMFKEDEKLRQDMVQLETELLATKQQLDKTKRDNIDLVDRISAERKSGGAGVAFEDEGAKALEREKARKKEETYQSYIRQFGKEYADEAMKSYVD